MSPRAESDQGRLIPAAGISIVVNRDGGSEDIPISNPDFGQSPSNPRYSADLTASSPTTGLDFPLDPPLFASSLDPSTGPAWLDGVGAILHAQDDQDYYRPRHNIHGPSPEPEPFPPSPILPFSGDEYHIGTSVNSNMLNSPLVPSFNSLSLSSPLSPAPSADFDYPPPGHHSRPDTSYDFTNPPLLQLPGNVLSSGSSSPSFLAVDRGSALFGDEHKDPLFDRPLPSLRVDTVLSSPDGIQHSPSPLSEPSPFPASPFPPPSLTHSSPSAYSPHALLPSSLLPPASNFSTLSRALDETSLSDSGLDDPMDRAAYFSGSNRRHSHTGLREEMGMFVGPTAEDFPFPLDFSDMGIGIPSRPGSSSSRGPLTPELPRFQFEGTGHDISRGRAADRLTLSTPGSRRASRSPYARQPSETKDDGQASGNGHKRNKTYDQFLNVPGVGPTMRLQPPGQGNSHQRRHSTGNHPRDSPPENTTSLIVPVQQRGITVPIPTSHRSSASDSGISVSPDAFQHRFLHHTPELESSVAGPSRHRDMDDSAQDSKSGVRRSARVRAAVAATEDEPSGSDNEAEDSKDHVRRETIASSATLKASGNRRKNDVKFYCPICNNGFTAKHNLQRE
ncbi:hypothetical protein ONZ45_g6094 [Pleurotus djamor]|nr:hypothetical protein ONZ45_g6094 [Pleurotus djamor]